MGQVHGSYAESEPKREVTLTINGVSYKVSEDILPGTSLNVFIRDHANLKGTKAMCHEGGCGACIVLARRNGTPIAVNSCLVPIFICDSWDVTTIEDIGNKMQGYHPIQATVAQMNASQCGFCSPGMVMNIYSLLQGRNVDMKEIENSLGSNICRCTGYRPILDAFKSFAKDAAPPWKKKVQDIEELYKIKACPKSGKACSKLQCEDEKYVSMPMPVKMELEDAYFYKVMTIENLFAVFSSHADATYVLNGGNTAHGVYRLEKPEIYVDVNDIPDLHHIAKDANGLTLGGSVSLTMAMESFEKYSADPGFEYLKHLANHIDLVAHVPVRNIGTIAGNLMIKHQHHEFPSDVFLILETAGANLHILEAPGKKVSVTLLEFLKTNLRHKVILSVVLPPLNSEYEFRSYKVMPRAQNAHAQVNAGFLFKMDKSGKVLKRPNVIFGGINPNFLHAEKTESFLEGKSIFDKTTWKKALAILDAELVPDHLLPDNAPEFRKLLAQSLFYKFVLSMKADGDPRLRSGGMLLKRGLSSGKQDWDTDRNMWPVNKPVPKLEAIHQASGEAEYVNDIPLRPNEVFVAFVLSTIHKGKIKNIDATEALEMKGVVAFFTAKDVPGKNTFINSELQNMLLFEDELLFADKEITFSGQSIGVVAAKTHALAYEAAAKVKVTYVVNDKPIITIKDAMAANDKNRFQVLVNTPAQKKGSDVKHVVKGEFESGSQYHYTMETHSCVAHPIDDGLMVYATTQWPDLTQVSIAMCLGLPVNSVNLEIRRIGGGYGSKISRATLTACACALVAYKLNRPARLVLSIEDNMRAVGKRHHGLQMYECGVDDDGRIQYLDSKQWSNSGWTTNEFEAYFVAHFLPNCYDSSTWSCENTEVKTDIPSSTYTRAPGSVEAIAMSENLMEHISRAVGSKDPLEVRMINMSAEHKKILQPMIEELMKTADYDVRRKAVETFNRENRWRKKGISIVPLKYPMDFFGGYNSLVSVYAADGTVSVCIGGVEMGQGLNTKVAQCVAYTLGIDLGMIKIKPTNTLVSPNQMPSGGSQTSEVCCAASMMACKRILKRLEPIRKELENPTWQELIAMASMKNVDLSARYTTYAKDMKTYDIYGVTIAEVEVDILTGQHLIQRVDLMEDAGNSLSPEIDVGQVEGAFVMGIGYWTSEELIYDPENGVLTNHRTWNYKPPGAKDIPVDFRIYLLRNSPNPVGVLRSKAVGEPPLCMTFSIPLAIRNALDSARKDAGNKHSWYPLNGPVTTEKILLASLTDKENMVLE